jgi:limonene-1,2-epoxide hydrolase
MHDQPPALGWGKVMGVAEEELVLEFLSHGHGQQLDVDRITAMMADDVSWEINVPSWKPRVGREVARKELTRQNTISTGGLPGSELLNIASNGGVVFTERSDIFEMGDKRITLRINAVFEVVEGKIAAWREYYDSVDLARQLGVDPNLVVEA